LIKYYHKGVGVGHLGSKAKAIVSAGLKIAIRTFSIVVTLMMILFLVLMLIFTLANYQEYLGKSYMINVPWILNTFWFFVKGLLDKRYVCIIVPDPAPDDFDETTD
jgi:hypothetical protein